MQWKNRPFLNLFDLIYVLKELKTHWEVDLKLLFSLNMQQKRLVVEISNRRTDTYKDFSLCNLSKWSSWSSPMGLYDMFLQDKILQISPKKQKNKSSLNVTESWCYTAVNPTQIPHQTSALHLNIMFFCFLFTPTCFPSNHNVKADSAAKAGATLTLFCSTWHLVMNPSSCFLPSFSQNKRIKHLYSHVFKL